MREMRSFLDFAIGGSQNINSVLFSNNVLRQVLNNRTNSI